MSAQTKIVLAALMLTCCTAAAGVRFPSQSVWVGFGPSEQGGLSLWASTFGASIVTLDSSKLHFVARPHLVGTTMSRERPLRTIVGKAIVTRTLLQGLGSPPRGFNVREFSMPLNIFGPPGPPGIYDVVTGADDAFARTFDERTIPLRGTHDFARGSAFMWWADKSNNDRALAKLRKKLVGRMVYGYGGSAISRRPDFTKFYPATTPLRVVSIERERGRIAFLGTGNEVMAITGRGINFIAFDPLSIVIAEPAAARYPTLGENRGVGGFATTCPAIELADWQIDTTLSLLPPPSGAPSGNALRVGMTRDEVIWARGYPNEIETPATLRAESKWHYGEAMDYNTITFVNDRVAFFTQRQP